VIILSSEEVIINIENLSRTYGKVEGIRNINLKIHRGEVFGFLGPNGSGKTTTINILLGLVAPSSGKTSIFGMDSCKNGKELRKRVGFLSADPGYYENMKGIEYLGYFANLRGKNFNDRIEELAKYFFNIDLNLRISKYSRGMKQLLGIIQAFMSSPDLYILDEPTDNLDPLMRKRFYDLVREEAGRGKTFLLSSHNLEEVEKLCSRTAIIRNGGIAVVETVAELREKMKKTMEVSFMEEIDPEELKIEGISSVEKKDDMYILEITGDLRPIFSKLSNLPVKTFDYHRINLEDIFRQYFEK
jgi:ABC-2 type transport system ATP-binding protein